MNRRFRICAAALAALLTFAVAAPHPAAADDHPNRGGKDNSAIAVNTKDGSSLFQFSFAVTRVMGDVVDNSNLALAYASCTECQTTALAIQFILVEGQPSTFTPENVAIAVNENCTLCDTLASAYQFVIQVDGPVRLTKEGRKRLHEIRKEIAALKDSGLKPPDLQARFDDLAHQAYQVMLTSLVPADDEAGGDHNRGEVDKLGGTTTTTTSTSTSSTSTTATTAAKNGTSTSTSSPSTTSTTARSTTTTAKP
jgi:putative peptide zinc metalloprotease protein